MSSQFGKTSDCPVTTDTINTIEEVEKIDNAVVDGLVGTPNSLSYKIEEIETHLHNSEYWYGTAVVPVAETHVADKIGPGVGRFVITGGNNNWGNYVLIH